MSIDVEDIACKIPHQVTQIRHTFLVQMAARDTGVGAVEYLLHQGKLLALDLLVKVFENPLHTWQNVRPQVPPPPPSFSRPLLHPPS